LIRRHSPLHRDVGGRLGRFTGSAPLDLAIGPCGLHGDLGHVQGDRRDTLVSDAVSVAGVHTPACGQVIAGQFTGCHDHRPERFDLTDRDNHRAPGAGAACYQCDPNRAPVDARGHRRLNIADAHN
jgi:hypothetical protein